MRPPLTLILGSLSFVALLLASRGPAPATATPSEALAQARYFTLPLVVISCVLALVVARQLFLSVRCNGWPALGQPLLFLSLIFILLPLVRCVFLVIDVFHFRRI